MGWDDEVAKDIMNGGHDGCLNELSYAITLRKRMLGEAKLNSFNPGDIVRIVNGRPNYLNGATAMVVKRRITKLVIEFPVDMGDADPYNKYAGRKWIFPPSLLERVEEASVGTAADPA